MDKKQSWLERHITLHNYDNEKLEKENAWTHFFGALLSVVALIMIITKIPHLTSKPLAYGMIIYGCTMLLLYTASGFYHYLPRSNAKRIFRILDHANIYFLIAGTYTPILLYINSSATIKITWLIWAIALVGICFTILFWGKFRILHVVFYLVMGWMIIFFWNSIVPFLPQGLLAWVIAGGVTYTLGVIFYANKKIPHYHAIWHLFCIAASLFFFIGFWRVLLP